jgi:hypothetical protein
MTNHHATMTLKHARALALRVQSAIATIEEFDAWAPVVVETVRGCGAAVWQCYDDAGGSAHSWAKHDFGKVRLVRNHPHWGPMLCAAVVQHGAMGAMQRAKALAERCADAYSVNRYASWRAVAAELIALGFNDTDAETIMRSKWTRWAADHSSAPSGRVPARAVREYVIASKDQLRHLGITPPKTLEAL